MAGPVTLETSGYGGMPVPNTYIRHEEGSDHLAVVLPGLNYTSMLAGLHYPSMLMWESGADILSVDYNYGSRPEFLSFSAMEREEVLLADAASVINQGLQQQSYSRITLLGKSLGTLAIAMLLESDPSLRGSNCIWLTPLLRNDRLRSVILQLRPRSLFVIGTADAHFDPIRLAELVAHTNGTELVLNGANHGLEIGSDVHGSVEVIARIVRSVEDFLAHTPLAR